MIATFARWLLNAACAGLLVLASLGDRSTLNDLARLIPQPQPTNAIVTEGPGKVVLRADPRGHFLVRADVDGQPIRFLVDTGASNVVLSASDAERLDLKVGAHDYTEIYSTPGGVVRAAPVRLGEVRIGALRMRNVRASVSAQPMDVSLLGASFLARLGGYEVSHGQMTLRW
ncbi:MAG: TIGR02281 family clan AA aspartic protease [Rhodospirillales bacterium]|nr:TIGR02281 family clan AA aspartic protease [Rhodospirillales bacterium]